MLTVRLLAMVLLAQAPSPAPVAVPADTLRVYLVRHGQALSNLQPPPALPEAGLDHLTSEGREQARQAGQALARLGVSLVVTSPAGRARETAAAMRAEIHGARVRVEPRLRPMDRGRNAEGRELSGEERAAEWKAGRDPVPTGGESLDQAGQRALALIESLAREGRGRSVAVVSHSEVIGSLLGRLEGKPAFERYPPGLANGAISLVEVAGTNPPVIVFRNRPPAEVSGP